MADCIGVDELWNNHAAEVERYVRRRVGCPALAQDLTSDVFLAVAKARRRDPGLSISVGYLFTVAHRRVVDHYRRADRRTRLVENYGRALERTEVRDDNPADQHVDLRWLLDIPHRQRTALMLRYSNDMTVAEVAEHMEQPYTAVESLLARARRSARRAHELALAGAL